MLRRAISIFIIISFLGSSFGPLPEAQAQPLLGLPEPGIMVDLSPAYEPAMIKGVTVHKDNPFLFDFIVDVGQDHLQGEALKKEGEKLIKYFLASLAIPEKELWVNLSPYEKNRTITEALSRTDMGRDLLAQDYILKQVAASLIYPEKKLGREFWDRVYAKTHQMYGAQSIPVNTFNKVWIMADKAQVFERNQTAFVVSSHLKVMLEEDYLALSHHVIPAKAGIQSHAIASQIVREILLPQLEHEVNTGKNFASLRQIFNSLILAAWYKKALKEAVLNLVYADQKKIKGINLQDPLIKELIYQRYLAAYKKGVFNYIKEEFPPLEGEGKGGVTIPRKYFSGGVLGEIPLSMTQDTTQLSHSLSDRAMVDMETGFNLNKPDAAMQGTKNGLIVSEEDKPYSPQRKVRTKNAKLLDKDTGKYELIPLSDVRKNWELELVVKSRTTSNLGLTWGDGTAIHNDSYWYGEDEFGKSAKKGRSPDWIYVLKPKPGLGLNETDRIYAGDYDIRHTFPENEYPQEYKAIENIRGAKEEVISEYARKVEDMRRMVILFHDALPKETLEYYHDILLPEVDALKGTIGVGDPSFETIKTVYAMFTEDWKAIYKGTHDVTMEEFFLGWNSFRDGLRYLNTKTVRTEGMPGVITDTEKIRFIINFVQALNRSTQKPTPTHPDLEPMPITPDFWHQADQLTDIFKSIRTIFGRLAERRRQIGRGQKPDMTHPDDVNRDGVIDANNLVAQELLDIFSKRQEQSPTILVAQAQDGLLREKIKAISPNHWFNIVDMEDNLDDANPQNTAVEAELQNIHQKTGFPVIKRRSASAANIQFDATFKARAIVATHVFNQYRRSHLISNALQAILHLLDDPNADLNKAPLLILTTPEGTLLSRTPFEHALFDLGFDIVAAREGPEFILTPEAKARLRERIINEMREAREDYDENEIDRRMLRAERSMRKPINYAVYARVRHLKPGTDISNLKMTKRIIEGGGGGRRGTIRGVLNWDYLRTFSNVVSLGDNAKQMNPQDSTRVYKRGDAELRNFEEFLDALQVFMHYKKDISLDITPTAYRQWETALSILKIWDEGDAPYLMHPEKIFMETFMEHFGIKPAVLRQILPEATEASGRDFGPLDIWPLISHRFYEALGRPQAGVYPIIQIYNTMMRLGERNAAMLSGQDRDEVRKKWETFVAEQLMAKGIIPTPETILPHLGKNAREQRANLRIFFNITQTPAAASTDEQLRQFVSNTVKKTVEDKIADIVLPLMDAHQAPTLEMVAAKLQEELPYFKAWQEQWPQENAADTLKKWVDEFNRGDLEGLGLLEKDERLDPIQMHEKMHEAVEHIKNNGQGLIADIDNVGDYLYRTYKPFQEWKDSPVRHGLHNGDSFWLWIKQDNPDFSRQTGLLVPFSIFLHGEDMRDWEVNKDQTPDKIERPVIYTDPQYANFDWKLAALAWSVDRFSDEYWQRVSNLSAAAILNLKSKIMAIRYLWDTQHASYLTKDQVNMVLTLSDLRVKHSDLPQPIIDETNRLWESFSQHVSADQPATMPLMNVYSNFYYLGAFSPSPIFNPQQMDTRPEDSMILVKLSLIQAFRTARIQYAQLLADGRRVLIVPTPDHVADPNRPFNLTTAAENLSYLHSPMTPEALRDWFKQHHIKPEFFGIEDSFEKPALPQVTAHMKQAADYIKNNGEGLIPDIYNVSDYLYKHSAEFKSWKDSTRPRDTNSEALFFILKQNYPQLDTRPSAGNLVHPFGMLIPSQSNLLWERNKSKTPNRIPRQTLITNPQYSRLEWRLSSLAWLSDRLTFQEFATLFNIDEDTAKRHITTISVIRFLWDTRKASYATKSQVDFINALTSQMLEASNLPKRINDELKHLWEGHGGRLGPVHMMDLYSIFYALSAHKPSDLFNEQSLTVRPADNLRSAKLSMIRRFREQKAVIQNQTSKTIGNATYVLVPTSDSFADPTRPWNLTSAARSLNYYHDPITPLALREWFAEQRMKPSFFGIEDSFDKENTLDENIKAAVEHIKNNGEGLIPDVFKVEEYLYEHSQDFKQWKDANAPNENAGTALQNLLKERPDIKDLRTDAYNLLGIYIPTEDERTWNEDISSKSFRRASKRQFSGGIDSLKPFEPNVTAFVWLLETHSKETLRPFLSTMMGHAVSDKEISDIRMQVARLRYLLDNQQASYLDVGDIDRLLAISGRMVTVENIPADLKSDLPSARAGSSVPVNVLNLFFMHELTRQESIPLRPIGKIRLTRMIMLIGLKEASKVPQFFQKLTNDAPFLADFLSPSIPANLVTLAAALNLFGDPVAPVQLSSWFAEEGFSPSFFGIEDSLQSDSGEEPNGGPTGGGNPGLGEFKLPEAEAKLQEAVERIKNNGEGLVPEIYNTGRYLYEHVPQFKQWADTHKDKETDPHIYAGKSLLSWLREFDRTMNEARLYSEFEILVPTVATRAEWEARKSKQAEIFERKDIKSAFEAQATIAFRFMDQIPESQLEKLLEENGYRGPVPAIQDPREAHVRKALEVFLRNYNNLKRRTAQIRYLWDTLNVSYLTREQTAFLAGISQLAFSVESLKGTFLLESSAGLDQATESNAKLVSLYFIFVMGEFTHAENRSALFESRSLSARRLAMTSMLIAARHSLSAFKSQITMNLLSHYKGMAEAESDADHRVSSIVRSLSFLHPVNAPLTFESLSRYLGIMGDKVSTEDLKAWFIGQGIDFKTYEIQEAVETPNPLVSKPSPAPSENLDWPKAVEAIKNEVATVQAQNQGLIVDIYSAGRQLYQSYEPFQQWVDSQKVQAMARVNPKNFQWFKRHEPDISDKQIRERAAIGNLLEAWIKKNGRIDNKEVSKDDIFDDYGVYSPSDRILNWSKTTQQAPKWTRKQLADPKNGHQNFELNLSSLVWLLKTRSKEEIENQEQAEKVAITKDEQKLQGNFRKIIAASWFLWDTMQMPYLTKQEVGLIDYVATQIDFPLHEDEKIEGVSALPPWALIWNPTILKDMHVKLPGLRSQNSMVLTILSGLFMSKLAHQAMDRPDLTGEQEEPLDDLIEQQEGFRVFGVGIKLNFDNVAAALRYYGIPFTAQDLKAWFNTPFIKDFYGIKPSLFGIDETGAPASNLSLVPVDWPQIEIALQEAAGRINGEGLMPFIDNVGADLYQHFENFKRWVDGKRRFGKNYGAALSEYLKEAKPGINLEVDLLKWYGIYFPEVVYRSWERMKNTAKNRIERKDLGTKKFISIEGHEYDAREFEARLTALIWFMNNASQEEIERIFPGNSVKEMVYAIRYLWDILGVSYIADYQVKFVYEATDIKIPYQDIPSGIKNNFQTLGKGITRLAPKSRVAYNIEDMFLDEIKKFEWDLMDEQSIKSVTRVFLLRPHQRLIVLSSLILSRNDHKRNIEAASRSARGIRALLPFAKGADKVRDASNRYFGNERQLLENEEPLTLLNVSKFLSHINPSDPLTIDELDDWFKTPFVRNYGITKDFFDIQDRGMVTGPGGIDLNTSHMALSVQKEGQGVVMHVDPAMIERIKREGIDSLSPVIYRITPVKSIWPLVGLKPPQ